MKTEQDFGHGARRHHWLIHKLKRFSRPRAMASAPFNWVLGHDSSAGLNVPIKNQYNSDSCGGQAGSYGMALALALLSRNYTELSAKSIYSRIFYTGGGTTMGSVENIFKRDGATLETEVPSTLNGSCPEIFIENTGWETTSLLEEATTRSGFTPITVSLDTDSFAQAIRDYGLVIAIVAGQDNGTWLSPNPKPPTNQTGAWNHFLCFYKADNKQGINAVYFWNSWGDGIGLSGTQYFTEDYFDAGAIVDAVTFATPAPIAPPLPNSPTAPPSVAEVSWAIACLKWISAYLLRLKGV